MKTYHRIHSALYSKPWCILPENHRSMQRQLAAAMEQSAGAVMSVDESGMVAYRANVAASEGKEGYMTAGSVAIVPVCGIIGKKLSQLDTMCGGCDVDAVLSGVYAAIADSRINCILLDFDTPGGQVTGLPEAARALKAAGEIKPIFGYTETMCCSAGMWLASSCGKMFASGSSVVGSIGVYCALMDETAALDKAGLKVNTIQSGDLKTMGASWMSLTDEQRGILQAEVDAVGVAFRAQMTSGRTIPAEAMRGNSMTGQQGLECGMIDGLCDSIDDLLEDLNGE